MKKYFPTNEVNALLPNLKFASWNRSISNAFYIFYWEINQQTTSFQKKLDLSSNFFSRYPPTNRSTKIFPSTLKIFLEVCWALRPTTCLTSQVDTSWIAINDWCHGPWITMTRIISGFFRVLSNLMDDWCMIFHNFEKFLDEMDDIKC